MSAMAAIEDQMLEVLGQGLAADLIKEYLDVAQGWTAEWELAQIELGVRAADLLLT
jgi:hypothetical protein